MKNRVREKRIEKGLNQNELAEKAKMSARQLSDIEHNKCGARAETLMNIASALGITVNDLLYEKKTSEQSMTKNNKDHIKDTNFETV